MSNKWDVVIGLEIHAQLQTQTKIFAGDGTSFKSAPNENISAVTLGMPGALPAINEKALELGTKIGLALGCDIKKKSVFSRKHYFYPDLPKGYQISQFDLPICEGGAVEFALNGELKKVRLERAHLEEDAGKSTHRGGYSLIDYNRAGVPLLEIVTKPDITSAAEAAEYARTVRSIVKYLDACDGNLEEGSMRCDCNVSIKPAGQKELGTRTEIKNVNSFRFVEKAIEYEIARQITLKESGEEIVQETRLYDSTKNKTFSMRSKEDAMDYRYFPDPDLLPVALTDEFIEKVRSSMPELPRAKALRFQNDYKLPEYDALVLTTDKVMAAYFEEVNEACGNPKAASNWIMGELLKNLKEDKVEFEDIKVTAKPLGSMIKMIDSGKISGKIAKQIFQELWADGGTPEDIVEKKGLAQISDPAAVEAIVDKVLAASPGQIEQYRSGKSNLYGFFVGQVMKESKGQANPGIVNKFLKEKLDT
ncbi:MAG: Asp-tRNA(Asn)/Glu-tRNA(Gln) amidotransferase subunit GatB [Bdellovibrionales bacterium]